MHYTPWNSVQGATPLHSLTDPDMWLVFSDGTRACTSIIETIISQEQPLEIFNAFKFIGISEVLQNLLNFIQKIKISAVYWKMHARFHQFEQDQANY